KFRLGQLTQLLGAEDDRLVESLATQFEYGLGGNGDMTINVEIDFVGGQQTGALGGLLAHLDVAGEIKFNFAAGLPLGTAKVGDLLIGHPATVPDDGIVGLDVDQNGAVRVTDTNKDAAGEDTDLFTGRQGFGEELIASRSARQHAVLAQGRVAGR